MVGETPSLTQEFVGKLARAELASCIGKLLSWQVPSLAPPPQAVPQHSKESCPALVNT